MFCPAPVTALALFAVPVKVTLAGLVKEADAAGEEFVVVRFGATAHAVDVTALALLESADCVPCELFART
jgi:hypothetical protein